MSILLFIVILALLILAHEFGHFIVAKRSGIKVDEFGIGFPPKLFSKKIGETKYSLNLFPVGGFVKIFGETPDCDSISGPDAHRSFVNKPKYVQAAVLSAGVVFNVLLAWILISSGFMAGLPSSVAAAPKGAVIRDVSIVVTNVLPDSPAEEAGLRPGDKIVALVEGKRELLNPTTPQVQEFISASGGVEVGVTFKRGKAPEERLFMIPTEGIIDKPAIGIAMDEIGIVRLLPHLALWEGAKLTAALTQATLLGIMGFIAGIFTGSADLSAIAGPVGIVSIVGEASQFGFIYLLSLTALISINLAIINLLPFPALDGGRLLFLLIEVIKGSPIKPAVANTTNAIGFALLIFLMVVITYSDILKIVTG
ncbi:MAG: RIP metalloprotease RseP [Patescibacteria group bacterium]|nr:MAG: RIP metalloprotease RseP [Patescibacteria group bacterium]